MLKRILFLTIVFFAGFFVHAWYFPSAFLQNNPATLLKIEKDSAPEPQTAAVKSLTKIDFTNEFNPPVVHIVKGYYIAITNKNQKKLMWLKSDNPNLATVRGYGYTEQVYTRLDERGSYTVIDKDGATLKVIVD